MTSLVVGQLYHPARQQWPEGAHYNYRAGAHELLVFLARPTAPEIRAIGRGASRFALAVTGQAIALCFAFDGDGLPWSYAPYSWHLVPEAERQLPSAVDDMRPRERAVCRVILVDAATGILRALRLVSFSPAFTRALHAAIVAQSTTPWDEAAYDRELDDLGSMDELLAAAVATCSGGA